MDYKELIEQLRNAFREDGYELEQSVCESAADAIETLLVERDAAVEDLRGMCWCCSHATPWLDAFGDGRLATCEYIEERGVLARDGGKCKCPHWQWRGPQKEENHPTPTAPAWAEHLQSRFLKME